MNLAFFIIFNWQFFHFEVGLLVVQWEFPFIDRIPFRTMPSSRSNSFATICSLVSTLPYPFLLKQLFSPFFLIFFINSSHNCLPLFLPSPHPWNGRFKCFGKVKFCFPSYSPFPWAVHSIVLYNLIISIVGLNFQWLRWGPLHLPINFWEFSLFPWRLISVHSYSLSSFFEDYNLSLVSNLSLYHYFYSWRKKTFDGRCSPNLTFPF